MFADGKYPRRRPTLLWWRRPDSGGTLRAREL